MERAENSISPIPDPRERLSLSLAEEVHSCEISYLPLARRSLFLRTNGNLDDKPFNYREVNSISKLDAVRKKKRRRVKTLILKQTGMILLSLHAN